jgi:hypothetical protein
MELFCTFNCVTLIDLIADIFDTTIFPEGFANLCQSQTLMAKVWRTEWKLMLKSIWYSRDCRVGQRYDGAASSHNWKLHGELAL